MTNRPPTSTVIAALEDTAAVQRLRRVSQAGAPSLFKATRSVTRYEHSVGVMRLAQRLGMSVEHQATALLHDVTHSAFSHTLDYLVANQDENTHEWYAGCLLSDTEITALLEPDQLTVVTAAILAKPDWLGMLDAVDYTLRDLRRAGRLDDLTAQCIAADLCHVEGQVGFSTVDTALRFTHLMALTGSDLYMDPVDLFFHDRLSALLDDGLQCGVMSFDELMTSDDQTILWRLSCEPAVSTKLNDFRAIKASDLRQRRGGKRMTSKPRLLDPLVLTRAGLLPLSELAPAWHDICHGVARRAATGVPQLTIA